jgi:hypothetical protein
LIQLSVIAVAKTFVDEGWRRHLVSVYGERRTVQVSVRAVALDRIRTRLIGPQLLPQVVTSEPQSVHSITGRFIKLVMIESSIACSHRGRADIWLASGLLSWATTSCALKSCIEPRCSCGVDSVCWMRSCEGGFGRALPVCKDQKDSSLALELTLALVGCLDSELLESDGI